MDNNNYDERVAHLALARIFFLEPTISRKIITVLGSARALFSLSSDELTGIFGPYSKYPGKIAPSCMDKAHKELKELESLGYQMLIPSDKSYPAKLDECEDAPCMLFVRSANDVSELFNKRKAVSVVGTRDLSVYGRQWCGRIIEDLASSGASLSEGGPTVVSGLALGIDTCAHMAALDCGLPTLAVLPVGIDDIYPKLNRQTACRIASAPGSALISDFPPQTNPVAIHFLRRNRIIAGLSDATAVIESKRKGGALVTARLAWDYGREVFALPGRNDDVRSQGCNALIRENIAHILVGGGQIMDSLYPGGAGAGRTEKVPLAESVRLRLSGNGHADDVGNAVLVAGAIARERGLDPEDLAARTGLKYRETAAMCRILEAEGFVESDLMGHCWIAKGYF